MSTTSSGVMSVVKLDPAVYIVGVLDTIVPTYCVGFHCGILTISANVCSNPLSGSVLNPLIPISPHNLKINGEYIKKFREARIYEL